MSATDSAIKTDSAAHVVASDALFSDLRGQRFGCILADPPWSYEATNPTCSWRPYLERGEAPQNVNHYYETMPLDQILAMPIHDIAEKDSVLFLWATVPLLPEAIRVMEAWGYKYKTTLTWEKENGTGMGYWFRGVTEHVLFGVRGNVKAFRSPVKNLLRSKRGRHSAKPQQFHDIIESVTPGMSRVELFGRYARANWTTWGNQVERDLLSPENDQAHSQKGRERGPDNTQD